MYVVMPRDKKCCLKNQQTLQQSPSKDVRFSPTFSDHRPSLGRAEM